MIECEDGGNMKYKIVDKCMSRRVLAWTKVCVKCDDKPWKRLLGLSVKEVQDGNEGGENMMYKVMDDSMCEVQYQNMTKRRQIAQLRYNDETSCEIEGKMKYKAEDKLQEYSWDAMTRRD